ncbi:hypothetical protein JL39_21980 [Rhizobium sp. YS-1r]|nr:hypothetical protein JL39_21980 [Rhizobium sp. YS-1r]
MPKPTAHIIDWFHIAMKIQPMQQIADHLIRSNSDRAEELLTIAKDIRAAKWRLWHGTHHGFADRLGVRGVIFLPFHVGLHIGRRHQPHVMPEDRKLSCPVMGGPTSLDTDEARRNLHEEFQHLLAT